MKTLATLLLCISSITIFAQTKIDTTFNFQNDPAKKLSIYIPSSYSGGTANGLMLGLHPWNTNRWNAKTWRDTLMVFAEENKLILICPDGGADGKVDDAIDIAFTTAMLDSIENWYNIDTSKIYAMGFSWGGKTTYTYAVDHPERFCGYMPIGAAISVREVALVKSKIKDKPIYIVHGSQDALSTRFTPLKKAMEDNGGIINSFLHSKGHTIDFPNRNQVLKNAFEWVDSVCTYVAPGPTAVDYIDEKSEFLLFPNPVSPNSTFKIENLNNNYSSISIIDMNGKVVFEKEITGASIRIPSPTNKGSYIIKLEGNGPVSRKMLLVK